MASSVTLTIAVSGNGKNFSQTITETGSACVTVEETVATAETDKQILIPSIDISSLKFIYISSSVDVLLETNAIDATGGDALSLIAGEPYVWHVSSLDAKKLTADIGVNGAYITNVSGSSAEINMIFITDATP